MDSNHIRRDLSSSQYHGMEGIYSSSQLKTMLEDPEKFYKDYITKENAKKESPAFDMGTYFHTAVLEPHLLNDECAIFTGKIRRGAEWEAFKEINKNKAILTMDEMAKANSMVEAVTTSPVCMQFIKGFEYEISAFVNLYVFDGEIYTCFLGEVKVLGKDGWVISDMSEEVLLEFGVKVPVKTRADSINFATKIISDLKSTGGNTKSSHEMKNKIDGYSYDLSAALYLDIFSAAVGGQFKDFIWIFASKDYNNAKPWRASDKSIQIGRAKWREAVILLAHYLQNGWVFEESLGELEPSFFQQEWLAKWSNK